jgi:hypothetical protein
MKFCYGQVISAPVVPVYEAQTISLTELAPVSYYAYANQSFGSNHQTKQPFLML